MADPSPAVKTGADPLSGREEPELPGAALILGGAEATAPPSRLPMTATAAAVVRFLPLSCTEPPQSRVVPRPCERARAHHPRCRGVNARGVI
ncbi:hypothetical protein Slala02_60760 [Streptomyces lavendulae subsp. lavendulae]|nr:hypothetical protein Slala01_21390 [Streptomyces lavendulae subsp. lavendulae]GLX30256.1 hypothetical protein Slala02_60760 [Streptomyces lavendulae subsp. lavendulae]